MPSRSAFQSMKYSCVRVRFEGPTAFDGRDRTSAVVSPFFNLRGFDGQPNRPLLRYVNKSSCVILVPLTILVACSGGAKNNRLSYFSFLKGTRFRGGNVSAFALSLFAHCEKRSE